MIRKIGIIVQGPNDRGFLLGLRDRLQCEAEFVDSRIRGKSRISVRRDAANNWEYFKRQGVQLVVRLTDSDADRWQDVKREEEASFPDDARSMLVCGVTEGTVEQWLAQDRAFVEERLGIQASESLSADGITGRFKSAVVRRSHGRRFDEAIREYVREAPEGVFRCWLGCHSFRAFYSDCRNAALREHDCPIHDELRPESGEPMQDGESD